MQLKYRKKENFWSIKNAHWFEMGRNVEASRIAWNTKNEEISWKEKQYYF